MNKTGERLTGTALALTGIIFILSSIGAMYLLIMVGGLLDALGGLALTAGTFTTYLAVGWVYTILQMASGFVALAAGIAILSEPKESAKTG